MDGLIDRTLKQLRKDVTTSFISWDTNNRIWYENVLAYYSSTFLRAITAPIMVQQYPRNQVQIMMSNDHPVDQKTTLMHRNIYASKYLCFSNHKVNLGTENIIEGSKVKRWPVKESKHVRTLFIPAQDCVELCVEKLHKDSCSDKYRFTIYFRRNDKMDLKSIAGNMIERIISLK